MRKLREANGLLDELTKQLETNMTQLGITDKELNNLKDNFVDKEKSDDLKKSQDKIVENDAKNVELFKERDVHKQNIDKQEQALTSIDTATANIEDFTKLLQSLDIIIKSIGTSIEKAQTLGKTIDTNKAAAVELSKKYKEKKQIYGVAQDLAHEK